MSNDFASDDFVGDGLVRDFEAGEDRIVSFMPKPSFSFNSWSPSRNKGGPKTQVHMMIDFHDGRVIALRLKSRRVCEEIIEALKKHIEDVWPTGPTVKGIVKDRSRP